MSDAILFDRDKVRRLDDIDDRPRRLRPVTIFFAKRWEWI